MGNCAATCHTLTVDRTPLHAQTSHHFHCALAAICIRVATDDTRHTTCCARTPVQRPPLHQPPRSTPTPRRCLSGLDGFFRALHTLRLQNTIHGPWNARRRPHTLLHSSSDPRLLAAHVERSTKHRLCWNSRCTPQWRQNSFGSTSLWWLAAVVSASHV